MIHKILCLLFITSISSANSAPALNIVNGNVGNISDFPYMVSIIFEYSDVGYKELQCGASILDESTVLTAGHCAYGNEQFVNKMRIGIGHTNISQATLVEVSKFYLHEEFVFEPPFRNDIAILKLVNPLTFDENVRSIQLTQAEESTPEGKKGVITGWGRDETGDNPKLLQKLDALIWNDDACESIWANVTETRFGQDYSMASNRTIQLCAKYPEPVIAGVCGGDSGGPLVVDGVQHGIVSYMKTPCGNSQYPVVFTRISHYLDWIVPKMG